MLINKNLISNCFPNIRLIDITHKDGITSHLLVVEACLEKGFNFGYMLYLPNEIYNNSSIYVKCANSGINKNNLEESKKAIFDSSFDIDAFVYNFSREYCFPVLRPLIPRICKDSKSLYTHALSSATYFTDDELFKNLDIQLINMIKDAKEKLELLGLLIDYKIIIEGFSAAGVFANIFTVLHPELIKLCIAGGTNGKLMLPISELNGKKLIYPVGTYNIPYYNDEYFEEFKSVRQLYYLGSEDQSDSLATKEINGELFPLYGDAYTKEEMDLFFEIYGRKISDRWLKTMQIYNGLGINAVFKTYDGYSHTDEPAIEDIKVELSDLISNIKRI